MNDVINKKTNRLNVETFASIQTVKYDLRANDTTSIHRYKRINFLRSPINRQMCKKMQLSKKAYDAKLEKLRQKRASDRKDMDIQPPPKRRKTSVHVKAKQLKKKVLQKK